ncbi:MAG TPA: hypothetical protein DCM28_20095 [Phycisphaerales bacterium]|nr:hypothetical protein [Phycisphaerales bacterium]HCD33688.1 hypothetical protein [Phycisphaerales bacterium]|tara:strand:- start:306 stop:998 length:693 start_codon:yes stop_codon:yes gene_type:complete
MKRLTGTMVVLMCLIIGCEQKKSAPAVGNVAVVDMDQIAQATGFDKALDQQMTQLNQQIGSHLQQLQKQIQSQLESKQKNWGESPTNQQKVEFEKLSMQLDQQYRAELNKAQQNSNQAHTTMVGQFRQKLDPIAMQVARERGFDIVISRTESVLMVSVNADITNDVLTRFKQINPVQVPATTPTPAEPPMVPALPDEANSSQQTPQPQPTNTGVESQQPHVTVPDTLPVQ